MRIRIHNTELDSILKRSDTDPAKSVQQCCGSGSARSKTFLKDPELDPELEVMDPDPALDPEMDLNLTNIHQKS
jgi:hypothetical protein